ncbi:pentapeptide repeat-containing protein [Pseudoalteromonas tunicata]|uniref:pentapeptide repeat-containing protein n=1 Tax=Pseudoalteromonas tunicata TaxID=314281 RepID=UPI00273DA804|nr:pentapeptide repeat-containing protein [Pseudoalteromonas tunicata]MDP4982321.1 pentapeptide repeat-containing protein [Pseudoalteromonas tunicata]
MIEKPKCKYCTPDNEQCQELDMGTGFCFWHDEKFDKSGLELKDKLERYAKNGGLLQGLKLKRANLAGLNLVRRGSKEGYDLSYCDFYRANLTGAHLFNTKMIGTSLMKADLRDANLHCCKLQHANLLGIKLFGARIDNMHIGSHLQQEIAAKEAHHQGHHHEALDLYEQSEEIYRDLRKAAEHQGLFELAGNLTHKEMTMRRYQNPRGSKRRIISKFIDLLCGYGEKPTNVIFFSLSLIFIAAIAYYFLGVNFQDQVIHFSMDQNIEQNVFAFLNCLYFSVVTFTTLGYGDITPLGFSRLIAAIEAFCGSFTLALFVVVFVKKMTR